MRNNQQKFVMKVVLPACLLLGVALWAKPSEAAPGWGTIKPLPFRTLPAMRLSPNGQNVLYTSKVKGKGVHYFLYNLKSKLSRPICSHTKLPGDAFYYAFGSGVWAPDSKSFVMLKRKAKSKLRWYNALTLARCYIKGKGTEKPWNLNKKSIGHGVFDAKGSFFFIRPVRGKGRHTKSQLCSLSSTGKKKESCYPFPGMAIYISRSPNRKAIGGLMVGETGVKFWAFSFQKKVLQTSRPFFTNDYYLKPITYWSRDSKALYANGDLLSNGKSRFSIFRFSPFLKKNRFQSFLTNQRYNTTGEFRAGQLLVFKRGEKKAQRFSLRTQKLSPLPKGKYTQIILGVVDAQGAKKLLFGSDRKTYLLYHW